MIVEAKSPDLQQASWRPKRSIEQFQSEFKSLRNRTVGVTSSPNPTLKAEDQCPILKTIRQRETVFPYSAFSSIQDFNKLYEANPYWGGQSTFLFLPNSDVSIF